MKHTLTLLTALLLALRAAAEPAKKANVIVFLVDDMGWMDCGAYGSQYYETPNIDKFAKRAMRFTDAYAQPGCSPTRCSLLTGQYSARNGVTAVSGDKPPRPPGYKYIREVAGPNVPMLWPESKAYMDPSEYTLAEALHDAGYRTAHIGKWHLGLTPPHWPERQGFDVAFHSHPDAGPPGKYFSPYGVKKVQPDGKLTPQRRIGTITDGPPGEYIVDRLADEAVKFIVANKDRPFFLNLWNHGVHGPWGHKQEYTKLFAGKKDPRGVQGNPIMASMLRSVDECFARVLDALDKNGLTDNTIVIFNSDNGGNTHSYTAEEEKDKKPKADNASLADWRKWAGYQPPTVNTPLRDGKGSLYEGGCRVPLMWSWPGHIKAGVTSDAIVGHIDLYPTLLDLIGIPKPAQQILDGVSYARVLRGESGLDRKAFFNYYPHGRSPGLNGVWVRSGDWKLIRWFGFEMPDNVRFELYNLRADLSETKNLAATQPALVKELDRLIDKHLADTGATYPRPNPAYNPTQTKTTKLKVVDPLEGWKIRQCTAVVKNGILTLKSEGKANGAFLGHTIGKMEGSVVVSLRVRNAVGGAGKIEWFGEAVSETGPKSVAFNVNAGDWQELKLELPVHGILKTLRLYFPLSPEPFEVDWIELRGQGAGVKPLRWEFNEETGANVPKPKS